LVLLIADTGNHRLLRVDVADKSHAGDAEVLIGGHGPGNELNQLRQPHGVAVDTIGGVYIADTGNDRVLYLAKGLEGDAHRSGDVFRGNVQKSFWTSKKSLDVQKCFWTSKKVFWTSNMFLDVQQILLDV